MTAAQQQVSSRHGHGVPYIGSKISLVTTSDIRYEGILFTLNQEESTIAVQNVRSFGTEGRKVPEVPMSNEIYDFIIFRGKDLKDLTVLQETPQRQPTTEDYMNSLGATGAGFSDPQQQPSGLAPQHSHNQQQPRQQETLQQQQPRQQEPVQHEHRNQGGGGGFGAQQQELSNGYGHNAGASLGSTWYGMSSSQQPPALPHHQPQQQSSSGLPPAHRYPHDPVGGGGGYGGQPPVSASGFKESSSHANGLAPNHIQGIAYDKVSGTHGGGSGGGGGGGGSAGGGGGHQQHGDVMLPPESSIGSTTDLHNVEQTSSLRFLW